MKPFETHPDDKSNMYPEYQQKQQIQPQYQSNFVPTANPNMQFQYAPNINNPMNDYFLKKQIDLEYEKEIEKIKEEKEKKVAEHKSLVRTVEHQMKKTEYEDISINSDDGVVSINTKNLQIPIPTIRVANFYFPEISVIHHLGYNGENILFFTCKIGQHKKQLFLSQKKCGKSTYFLNKLMDIGGEIMANSLTNQKKYATKLLNFLINTYTNEFWVPDRKGWYKDNNGNIKFWKEEYTWETLFELTK